MQRFQREINHLVKKREAAAGAIIRLVMLLACRKAAVFPRLNTPPQ
jgi:hypothetical protein